MSKIFEVSTDYLLKDEVVEEQGAGAKTADVYEAPQRSISLDEANAFLQLTEKLAKKMAAAVSLLVISPVPLVLLAGMQEYGSLQMNEDMAGGLGAAVLLMMVAVGVAVLVLSGMRLSKYEYLATERFSLQYGVSGIVSKKKEDFAQTFRICLTAGVVLCILGVVPLLLAMAVGGGDLQLVFCLAILLAMISIGIFLFVWSGTIEDSFDKLLEEGDFTPEKKELEKKTSFFNVAYWCLAVAIYLAVSLSRNNWHKSWIIWPVAALLFVVIRSIIKGMMEARKEKRD